MPLALRRTSLLAALAVLAACSDPKDMAGWAERASSRNRLDEKLAALTAARSAPGDKKAAVTPLCEVLKQAPRARQQAAVILGEIGDPAAVKPLTDAIDTSGKAERDVNDANVAIAGALGALRSREAVPALARLAASPDAFTQVAAIDALGLVGDPAAVDTLLAKVADEQGEPFAIKKALLALGRLGDARAVPTVVRMLFMERPGVSFFPEAAFAASQLGAPVAGPLVRVVQGQDAELARWAAGHGVHPAALRAKAAQLLGDVGGPESVPALVGALAFTGDSPDGRLFVRAFAAESLGRLGAREAVAPLAAALAKEKNTDLRNRYADALARIGDPAALPALRKAGGSGSREERGGALDALSRLGGEAERPLLEAAWRACGEGCPAIEKTALGGMVARLDAAKACGADLGCWTGRLGDARAEVRDRAALEVGRGGGAAQVDAVAAAVTRPVESDADLTARYHAVLALDAIARRAPPGKKGADIAAAIEKVAAADKGRTLTAGVNEDALRLAGRLRKGAR
jgi:HEAT repeat protein